MTLTFAADLGQLGLPPREEVRLISNIVSAFGALRNMPTFLKKKRKTSRALGIWDFVRPVQTAAEHNLFLECFALVTRGSKTDWLAFTREYIIRVCQVWEEHKAVSDLYLKERKHLEDHQKAIVLQASQAEVSTLTSATTGLPATASPFAQQPFQLRPPGPADCPANVLGQRKANECRGCSRLTPHLQPVYQLEHDCFLHCLAHGLDPVQLKVKNKRGYKADMSPEELSRAIADRRKASDRDHNNIKKRLRDQGQL